MVAKLHSIFQRHTTFLAIFVLAMVFRLLALLLFRPGGFIADASDYDFYYLWGQQIPQGYQTFINLWTAYPPLFPALMLPIFEWSSRIPPWIEPRLFFHLLFGLFLLFFESGNLILIYRLAIKLGHPALAHSPLTIDHSPFTISPSLLHPALFYALLFTPVYTLLGWFEAMPLFFMLWGLDLLLSKRPLGWLGSAVMAALGFLTKLTPALLVPIAVRWLGSRLSWQALKSEWFNPRSAGNLLRPTLYVLLFTAIVFGGGYWLVGGHTELALSSFTINSLRPPWESIWALLVDNYDWGRVPLDMRNLVALETPPATAQLPWGWITLAFMLLYLWLYSRRYDWSNPRTPVVFAAISVIWLFLYSKGWSPQFLVWILAFVVLLLPTWQGITLSIGLSLLNVIESPIFFTMLGNERWILTGVVFLRTALLVALAVELACQIWPMPHRQIQRVTAAATALLLVATFVGIAAGLPRAASAYADQRLADHPCQMAIAYLQEQADWPETRILSDQIDIWRDLYPWLRQEYQIEIIDGYDAHDRPWAEMIAERLDSAVGNEPFWWVTYTDQPSHAERYFALPAVHIIEEQQLGACRVVQVMRTPAEPLAVAQVDGGPIELTGLALDSAKVGGELHLVLYWQTAAPVAESYTVFVHLLDAAGQLVAQQDNLPVTGLAPTDTWQPEALIRDPYRLIIPETVLPGAYQVQVGLYTEDGRVPIITAGVTQTDFLSHKVDIE